MGVVIGDSDPSVFIGHEHDFFLGRLAADCVHLLLLAVWMSLGCFIYLINLLIILG